MTGASNFRPMRIFFQILLGFVAFVIGILAIGVTSAWWAVGTPAHAASTAAATLSSTEGALGIGDMLLTSIIDNASPDERQVIEQRRGDLVNAAAAALEGQQEVIQSIVSSALVAVSDGTRVDVDAKPVMNAILANLHKVNPEIPAQLDVSENPQMLTIDGTSSELTPIAGAFRGMGLWWIAFLVLAVVVVLDALVGRRGGMRRWLIPSIFLALPGLLWLVISFVAPGAVSGFSDNVYQAGLIKAGVSAVSTKIMIVSLIVIVIALVLFVLSLVVRGRDAVAPPEQPAAAGMAGDEPPMLTA